MGSNVLDAGTVVYRRDRPAVARYAHSVKVSRISPLRPLRSTTGPIYAVGVRREGPLLSSAVSPIGPQRRLSMSVPISAVRELSGFVVLTVSLVSHDLGRSFDPKISIATIQL